MNMRRICAAVILAMLATGAGAQISGSQGDPGKAPGGGERHHGPPPAAIAACKGLAAGAGCSFAGRENQNRSGTCFSPAADKPLACRPERGARGGQGGAGAAKG